MWHFVHESIKYINYKVHIKEQEVICFTKQKKDAKVTRKYKKKEVSTILSLFFRNFVAQIINDLTSST